MKILTNDFPYVNLNDSTKKRHKMHNFKFLRNSSNQIDKIPNTVRKGR